MDRKLFSVEPCRAATSKMHSSRFLTKENNVSLLSFPFYLFANFNLQMFKLRLDSK